MDQNSSLNVPVEPTPPPSKLPLILLILVLAVASGAAGFFLGRLTTPLTPPTEKVTATPVQPSTPIQSLTPAPTTPADETANWKTYENKTMGFGLKLPNEWFTHQELGENKSYVAVFSYPVDNPSNQDWVDGQKAGINVSVYQPEDNEKALETWAKVQLNQPYSILEKEMKTTVLAGTEAFVLNSKDGSYRLIGLDHLQKRYMVSIDIKADGVGRGTRDKLLSVFDQILSTFRFLD